jgi:hypothetical protein
LTTFGSAIYLGKNMKTSLNIAGLVEQALKDYPTAKRRAVENFCFSAPEDKTANAWNLNLDSRLYHWNTDTINAIFQALTEMDKI